MTDKNDFGVIEFKGVIKIFIPTLTNCTYADYLTPIVLLAKSTGMRRGVQWVELDNAQIT